MGMKTITETMFKAQKNGWRTIVSVILFLAGKANVITIPDGSAKNYSYTIYNLPRACRDFEYGDKIRVKLFGNEVKEFVVLGFHRYQLQCKIWV